LYICSIKLYDIQLTTNMKQRTLESVQNLLTFWFSDFKKYETQLDKLIVGNGYVVLPVLTKMERKML